MRGRPAIAFAILVSATSIGSSLAAPASNSVTALDNRIISRQVTGALISSRANTIRASDDRQYMETYRSKRGGDGNGLEKRAADDVTAGGNAHSGSTSSADGGSVANHASADGSVDSTGGNTAGNAGTSETGDATGGSGDGHGPGGNAYTGSAGTANGGHVSNEGGTINNGMGVMDANQGGMGGHSITGTARGGSGEKNEDQDSDFEDELDHFDDDF